MNMKAKVQYNDLVGTAAADISDFYLNSLNDYLKQRYPNFDWNRYYCVGCSFYASYGQYASVSFICNDKIESKYCRISPSKEFTLQDFFELFKRFSIVMTTEGHVDIKVDEKDDITI